MSRISGKLKGLSLDRLETLSQVLAGGGISRAAGGDANRQSQFSRQIAELEGWFGVALVLMEGGGSFHRFAAERSAAAGVDLDAAVLCSSWSQIAECMGLCNCGGFLPRDM
jgi:DNA-binding transcriptional LysR family regulator